MDQTLTIGSRLRPRGGMLFGTLGCFVTDGDVTMLVTCDHVLRKLMSPSDDQWEVYFDLNHPWQEPVAIFEGISMAVDGIADIALARCLLPVDRPSLLPMPMDQATHAGSPIEPVVGEEVFIWSGLGNRYIRGTIQDVSAEHSWPHSKYGLMKWREQFSVQVADELCVGDSGGPIFSENGQLIGFVSGSLQNAPDDAIVYCVPALSCFNILGVAVLD